MPIHLDLAPVLSSTLCHLYDIDFISFLALSLCHLILYLISMFWVLSRTITIASFLGF